MDEVCVSPEESKAQSEHILVQSEYFLETVSPRNDTRGYLTTLGIANTCRFMCTTHANP